MNWDLQLTSYTHTHGWNLGMRRGANYEAGDFAEGSDMAVCPNKDYSILGSILGSPYLGKLPFRYIPSIGKLSYLL